VKILNSLSLLTREGDLTVLGRAVAAIPVQPNVAKFLLIAAAFRVIKPAACIAAFLSIKSPFQQTPHTEKEDKAAKGFGKDQKKKAYGKDYFNKGFASDHFTMVQAYVEWRRELARGNDLDFCDQQGLSPEILDMASMMVQQFVTFMVDAGYDGPDVTDGDYADVKPVKKGLDEDALVRAAMCAAFQPNIAVLYKDGRSDFPIWWTDTPMGRNQDEGKVQVFRGSANYSYAMAGQDGDEGMVFNDAMKMSGRYSSIMESSLVFSPFVLLFASALMVDEKKGEIRFDRWYAFIEAGPWVQELLELRKRVMPAFKEAIEARDLAAFPLDLCDRIRNWCCRTPIKLKGITPVERHIDEEVTGVAARHLSKFEWPKDDGPQEEDDEQ